YLSREEAHHGAAPSSPTATLSGRSSTDYPLRPRNVPALWAAASSSQYLVRQEVRANPRRSALCGWQEPPLSQSVLLPLWRHLLRERRAVYQFAPLHLRP